MMENWREILYPLGYLASFAFGGRFLLQWITSEVQQRSVVTRAFWRLSLLGNLMLMLHAFLQLQFHVCWIQACNGVISWRNLDLMKASSQQAPFRKVINLFIGSTLVILGGFLLQGYVVGYVEWFRLPASSAQDPLTSHVGWFWHVVGFIGLVLFSSRFWVQWWHAEKAQTSYLGPLFWWLSLVGGLLTVVYFVRIDDPVNVIGPAIGLVPYIRNLILLRRAALQPGISRGVA